MEIITMPADEFRKIMAAYQETAQRLIEVEREKAALKEDSYVTWDWVCKFFDVSPSTAKLMLADEKIFVHRKQIKRLRKSDVLRYAERNSVLVKYVPS